MQSINTGSFAKLLFLVDAGVMKGFSLLPRVESEIKCAGNI